MDWSKVLENSLGPLFGSFAGAAAALSSLWIRDWLDRRRSVQEWFEQEYVLGAINPLIELLQRWTQMILHEGSQPSLRVDFSTLPHLEITRLDGILRASSLNRLFYLLSGIVHLIGADFEGVKRPAIDWPHITSRISLLQIAIMDLQTQLLAVRISRKANIARLHLRKEIAAIGRQIEDQAEDLSKDHEVFRLRAEVSQSFEELADFHHRLEDAMASGLTRETVIALRNELRTLAERRTHLFDSELGNLSDLSKRFDDLVKPLENPHA